MIKSWWAEKSTSEKQIVAALAVLSLGVFCWLGVIKPIDTYIAEHQSHAQKIKKDIKWMQDQASSPRKRLPLAHYGTGNIRYCY